jgi:hypothetical protein
MPQKCRTKSKHWSLYWVESDGIEDCFVVARNSRSACAVEASENDFDLDYPTATKIMPIPKHVENSYQRQNRYKENPWPGYPHGRKFFEGLGAEFRKNEKREEMLLRDVVYAVEEYAPCGIFRRRSIGSTAIAEMKKFPAFYQKYDDEDIWNGRVIHLITGLGMCLIRCQQIEHYIAPSFVLGASKKQQGKYETINDLRAGWKKKTFGSMLQSIEEAWEIHPLVKESFDLFLEHRNFLIHHIATSDQYDIRTNWGQDELVAFLTFFDAHSRMVKKAFRASFYASVDFGAKYLGVPEGTPKKLFNKKQREEIRLFAAYFTPKSDAI